MTPAMRRRHLQMLQEHYAEFPDFLHAVMTGLLGFECSDIQEDIGRFMADPTCLRQMVQAQRRQAKTTIAAAFAVWDLIQSPQHRVMIISAGDDLATEIANWAIQIFKFMPELDCMLPAFGQRSAVDSFEIHQDLRGPEKSPSIACMPIFGNMQGRRADLLIADDIESSKNAFTATAREKLAHVAKDFVSICPEGKILYLGTPQSIDSIYNNLPSRGYTVRIWPGRYPSHKAELHYGELLAPFIRERVKADPTLRNGGGLDGTRGKPVDPLLLGEDVLCAAELDQGPAYFNLQYMLDTQLTDELRFPLKLGKMMFYQFGSSNPIEMFHSALNEHAIKPPNGCPVTDTMYRVAHTGNEFIPYNDNQTHMFIDPGGGGINADEHGWAVSRFIAGMVHVQGVGGIQGGYSETALDKMIEAVFEYDVRIITIEDNYGNGAFRQIFTPRLHRACKEAGRPLPLVEGIWNHGQKELRIIDTIEPVIGAGKVVFAEDIIEKDIASVQHYSAAERNTYSVLYQIARITRDRGALKHDDRIEAIAGTLSKWVPDLDLDEKSMVLRAQKERLNKMLTDPLGSDAFRGTHKRVRPWSQIGSGMQTRHQRRFKRSRS